MIKLKTKRNPKLAGLDSLTGTFAECEHDCVVAHAYQEALKRFEYITQGGPGPLYNAGWAAAIETIHKVSAELLKEWGVENG